jgi:GNAT superfamily N-acetyltransferase
VGGLLGEINHGWLFVSALWVDEDCRRVGIGTALMRAAEEQAGSSGCTGVFLDTYSFQARPFYERLRYTVFGVLRDCPIGEQRYYMSKQLSA